MESVFIKLQIAAIKKGQWENISHVAFFCKIYI